MPQVQELYYQGMYSSHRTVWADNICVWEHAREVLLHMSGEKMVNFKGDLFDGCLSDLQVTPSTCCSFASARRAMLV